MLQFIWPDVRHHPINTACPVCGHLGGKAQVLTMPGCGPRGADWCLVECPECHCRFSTDRDGADYHGSDLPDMPFVHFYMEQGAGLRTMLDPLGFAEPGPYRFLEIGGGFGFPSDYMQTVLGWTARGYDPSGLAVMGQRYLGLNIVRDYWTSATPLDQPFDVAYASEVIEHIPEPAPFLAAMRHAVGDTGIVVLTTPNGLTLRPDTTQALLIPIASPGLHVTLFSAEGLSRALHAAGFKYVRVLEDGIQLQAIASNGALPAPQRLPDHRFVEYLRRRIATPDLAPPLLCGLLYRLLKEQVNANDAAGALETYAALRVANMERFGIDIARPQTLSPPMTQDARAWLGVFPGNITGMMFYRAVLANNVEADAKAAAHYAGRAALVGASLRVLLRSVGVEDGETEAHSMAAVQLYLTAAAVVGADIGPLLHAIEHGKENEGLLLPGAFRASLRANVSRDLAAMRHPAVLWLVNPPATDPQHTEVDLLRDALQADLPQAAIPALLAVEHAPDSESVIKALAEIDSTPGAADAIESVTYARKLALIRLVILGAYGEATALFDHWNSPHLAEDHPVSNALAIAAAALSPPASVPDSVNLQE